jgi:mono/diheme cytochrome c family protein
MRLALAAVLTLLAAAPAQASVRIVPPFDPVDYADRAAVGLLVVRNQLHARGAASSGPEILVSRPAGGRFERGVRYPVALLGERGLLTSNSTRIAGLLAAPDVASGELRVVPHDDPVAALERLDERIDRNDSRRLPLTIALATLLIGLALLRPQWALRALLVVLAANLWLDPLLAVVAGVAVLALPLGLACGAILAAYLASMGIDAETVALSPFGPSQSGRFYGINNLLETLLLAPALAGAALLGRWGVGVAALAFVTIGGNRLGADGGGIVVLAAAYLVLVIRLQGRQLTWRLAALAAAGAVALALGLLGIDAATGGSSHVTDAVGDGPIALAGDIGDRLEASFERTTASLGATAVVLGSLAILAAIALRGRRQPVLDAFLVGLAVSLVVNDTPGDVLGMGAAIAIVLTRRPIRRVPLRFPSMRRAATLAFLLALLVGAAGCGGGEEAAPLPETQEGTVPAATTSEAPEPSVEGDAAAGESIYASAGCGGCHTLEAAGSSGSIGPNLDDSQPDFPLAFDRVKNGRGAMPSFEDQLSEQQIADVAQYVAESAG